MSASDPFETPAANNMSRAPRPSQVVPDWYTALRSIIRDKIGFVLQPRPTAQLRALFESRVRVRGTNHTADFLAHLKKADPTDPELMALINVVTIKKTHFFRDLAQFEGLRDLMRAMHTSGRPLTIWCAGCSTGEEPYSIAMLAHAERIAVEILGSDINTDVLATARRGEYTKLTLGEIPDDYKSRFLMAQERGMRVSPEIARMVGFTHHNLLDPYYPRPHASTAWDIVLCRNVLIYFESATVERVVGHVHGVLKREGRLLLGAGESLHSRQADYDLVRLGRSFAYRPAPIGSRPLLGLGAEQAERMADQSDAGQDVAEIAKVIAETARSGKIMRGESVPQLDGEPVKSHVGSADRETILATFRRGNEEARRHAIRSLRQWLEQDPNDGPMWLTLGNALFELGELDEALEAYQTGQTLTPLNPEAHYLMGLAHKKTGARGSAIQAFRRALFLDAGFWPAAYHLAGLYQQDGMVREAIGEYRNALRTLAGPAANVPLFESKLAGDEHHGHFREEIRATCETRLAQLGGA